MDIAVIYDPDNNNTGQHHRRLYLFCRRDTSLAELETFSFVAIILLFSSATEARFAVGDAGISLCVCVADKNVPGRGLPRGDVRRTGGWSVPAGRHATDVSTLLDITGDGSQAQL